MFQVHCEASGTIIRAVLSQEGRPVAYFSEKWNDAKESILFMIKKFMI